MYPEGLMKITRVKSLIVNGGNLNWVFVKIETSSPGLYGWGEASLEWKPRTIAGAIADLENLIKGQDPRRIEHIWQILYRQAFYRGGVAIMSAISGIDQACWDILGKSLGAPVYQLLGGAVRDRVRVYGHMTGSGKKSKKKRTVGEIARDSLLHGLTALKFGPQTFSRPVEGAAWIKRVRAKAIEVRRAVGDDVDLMADFHGQLSPAMGVQCGKAVEDLGLLFIEEPCLPKSVSGMAKVAREVSVPVAAGERLVTRYEFAPLFEARAIEIAQPDPSHCGGISETRKIAAQAEAHYCSFAPHNPLGPINTQVCFHLDMATPNFLIQEIVQRHVPWRFDVVTPPMKIEKGYVHPGNRPGLGIEVNEKECAKHPFKQEKYMQFFHEDGSVADW